MLMPKRVKYRKPHSAPRIKGVAKRGATVAFGEYGLKALEPKWSETPAPAGSLAVAVEVSRRG